MRGKLNYSGFIIAAIGFFLTRFTVTLAVYDEPIVFYLAGIVPLTIGLGLAAFGVALAVTDVDPVLVRRTAVWCVIGLVTMLMLVVLTVLGSDPESLADIGALRSQAYLSNFLIGGSVGGTITGLYAARNRRHRGQLRQQANRLVTLNRLLRHEILNAVTAIRGYAQLDPTRNPGTMEVVDKHAGEIEEATEEIKYLTQHAGGSEMYLTDVDLGSVLTGSIERIEVAHPSVSIEVDELPEGVTVSANRRLTKVFTHLLENAIVHGNDQSPHVTVDVSRSNTTVAVTNEGPPLPENQQRLLETGDIEEFDDPMTGFGLNVVRLLVESYGGSIRAETGDGQTTIAIRLSRGNAIAGGFAPTRADLSHVRPALPHLVVVLAASLIAGIVYGIASELLGGSVAGIGVFYGNADLVVGWLTHEFHSVVFGFMYVGLLTVALERARNETVTYLVVGLIWGVIVWLLAASIVAPVWLRLLGISASVPSLSPELLVSHLAWGAALGLLTAWGYRHVTPVLSDLGAWWRTVRGVSSARSRIR